MMVLKQVSFILLLFFLAACGQTRINQDYNLDRLKNDPAYTGLVRTDRRGNESAYTETKATGTLQKTKNELEQFWKEKGIQSESQKLSRALSQMKVVIQTKNNQPSTLTAQLKVGSTKLKFNSIFSISGNEYHIVASRNINASENVFYVLTGRCLDQECSEVQIFISKQNQKRTLAKSGFIFRPGKIELQARLPKGVTSISNSELRSVYEQYRDKKENTVNDYVVAEGISTSEMQIPLGQRSLCLSISNLQTDTSVHEVSEECLKDKDISVTLVGNTGTAASDGDDSPTAADQLLLLQDKLGERVYIEANRSDVPEKRSLVPQNINDDTVSAVVRSYIIPVNTKDKRVIEITKGFEKYRNWGGLPSIQRKLISDKSFDGTQRFFNNIKDASVKLKKHFDDNSVPATLLYVTSWETGFFKNPDGFDPLKPNYVGDDCELGPWQFMYSTAKVPLLKTALENVFRPKRDGKFVDRCKNIRNEIEVDANDDRLYVATATEAAARYLSYLISQFPDEPVFGIMAYNLGPGSTDKVTDKFGAEDFSSLQVAQDLGYTFEKVNTLRIKGVEYVRRFLGIYFIGANPESHKINRNQPGHKLTCSEMYSPLKQNLCKI